MGEPGESDVITWYVYRCPRCYYACLIGNWPDAHPYCLEGGCEYCGEMENLGVLSTA